MLNKLKNLSITHIAGDIFLLHLKACPTLLVNSCASSFVQHPFQLRCIFHKSLSAIVKKKCIKPQLALTSKQTNVQAILRARHCGTE